MDVRLLGHLEVEVSGEPVRFEGVKQRRLFAVLALRAPDAVSADELVEALWRDEPPAGAGQALQKQVSRLRRRLGDGGSLVRHRPPGYALDVEPQAIDSRRFEELLRRARVALGRDDPERAVADLQTALALWRGEPLADYRLDEFAQREIARLEELRPEAVEERLAAELARGGAEDVVGELQALVAEHPLRERLRGQLMVALYRAGRQAEALEIMRAGRQLLVDELGIEPGPDLRRLERMIVAHDSALTTDRPGSRLVGRLPAPANETIGRGAELEHAPHDRSGEHLPKRLGRLESIAAWDSHPPRRDLDRVELVEGTVAKRLQRAAEKKAQLLERRRRDLVLREVLVDELGEGAPGRAGALDPLSVGGVVDSRVAPLHAGYQRRPREGLRCVAVLSW
jgi:DNA-binding SARP family transcriptional activator